MTYASVWKVVFLSFLLALTACDSPEETEAKHISQGKILYENEEYDKARLEFKNAYQINPTSAEALYHLGLIAEAGKKWKQAYGAYSKVQLQVPAHIGANIHLGRIFLMAGDMDKAISHVDRVLESEVGNVEALALRGAIKFRQDDLAGAETDSLATLKLAPGDIAATTVLAATYRKQGDIQKSLQAVDNGLSIHGDDISLNVLKAALHLAAKENDAAEQVFLGLIKRQPDVPAYRVTLVKLYIAWKRKGDAEKLLRDAIALAPEDDKAKLLLADFLANQKGFEHAAKELDGFIKDAPENLPLRFGLATLYSKEADQNKAREVFEDIRQLDPTGEQGIVASNALARIKFQEKDYDAVRELVSSVLEAAPKNGDALIMHARLLLRGGNLSDAVISLRSVLRDRPDSKTVHALLAAAHLKSRDWRLARDILERLIQLAPESEPAQLDLVRVLLRLGEANAAVDQLETYTETAPKSLSALTMLTGILIRQGQIEEAKQIAERMSVLEGGKPIAQAAMGRIYLQQKKYSRALIAYRDALTYQPMSEPYLFGIVSALVAQKKIDAAQAQINQFLSDKKNSAFAYNMKGDLYLRQKMPELAYAAFHKAIELRPNWKDPYLRLGQELAKQQSNMPAALALLEQGYKKTSGDVSIGFLLAVMQQRLNKIDDAIQTYETILEKNPKHQIAANNYASLITDHQADDRAQLERALAVAEQFRTAAQAPFLDTLGWVHLKLGNVKVAVGYLEQAVEKAPESNELKLHLGEAYIADGQFGLARKNLDVVLSSTKNEGFAKRAQTMLTEMRAGPKK